MVDGVTSPNGLNVLLSAVAENSLEPGAATTLPPRTMVQNVKETIRKFEFATLNLAQSMVDGVTSPNGRNVLLSVVAENSLEPGAVTTLLPNTMVQNVKETIRK